MARPVRTVSSLALLERRHAPGRPRVPEPMAMSDPKSIDGFHAGGTTAAGMQAVYEISARSLDALVPGGGLLLDLGTGSGRGLCRFLATRPDVRAIGVDLAPEMLARARRLLDAEGIGERVSLVEGDLTALPGEVSGQRWDAISSVWALHHMPNRDALAAALRQMAQLRERDRAALWLFDFQRLRNANTFGALLDALQPEISSVLHADGVASEAAAFTQDELRAELVAAGMGDLASGCAQPIPWLQAFWGQGRRAGPPPTTCAPRSSGLNSAAEEEADLLHRGFSRLPY